MVRTDWFISNLLGGVKLNVAEEDAEAAIEVLDQPLPEEASAEGNSFRVPECPLCHSTEVAFEKINKKVFLVIRIPIPRNRWKCYDCGATWEEVEDESPSIEEGQKEHGPE
jgi:transposase-like protein